ncbi:uncharacterized protein LOC117116651 [Anneissia japonica]|uniref:uncharacterized protein LOC117116651 n=1 Tax=Anneissia japonica TaxID=1529436 RepID=UPI0014257BE0|nr:uncharacterized protein LOC117116651 [Anneissia japonica]
MFIVHHLDRRVLQVSVVKSTAARCHVLAVSLVDRDEQQTTVQLKSIDWSIGTSVLVIGEDDNTTLKFTANINSSSSLMGTSLWKLSIFRAKNKRGIGTKYSFNPQILSAAQQATPLLKRRGSTQKLSFTVPFLRFDLSGVGCFKYICLKLNKNDDDSQDYRFIEGTLNPNCKRSGCYKSVNIGFDARANGTLNTLPRQPNNEMTFDVDIISRGPIGITGKNSWNVAVYATSTSDGKGTRYNEVRQALTSTQSATRLIPFTTSKIGIVSYNLDMTDLNCEQAQYVCLHLSKCQESQYDFVISPTNANFDEDENALYKYFPLDCDGDGQQTLVQISSIVWSIGTSALVIGEDDNTTLKYKAQMSEKSKYVEGTSLWRIGIFGAENIQGTGTKYSFKPQVLSAVQQATPLLLKSRDNIRELSFTVPFLRFDLSGIGCGKFKYICSAFDKNEDANPDYRFEESALNVNCKKSSCYNSVNVGFDAEANSALTVSQRQLNNEMDFDVNIISRGPIGINGENSWNVAVYATDSADGKSTRYNQVRQALNNAKSATRLVPFTTSNIGIVSYNLNMTDLICEQAQYVCLHLTKCQESQYDFMISPTNANFDEDENAVYKCFPLDCDGDGQQTLVQISSIFWSIGTSALVIGEDDNTTLKYKAQMSEKSKYVEGTSLWRIGVFGAENIQGTGTKYSFKPQVLSAVQQATPLLLKSRDNIRELSFTVPFLRFDRSGIGCGKFKYICSAFDKNEDANPDYRFEESALNVNCKKSSCYNSVNVGFDAEANSALTVSQRQLNNEMDFDVNIISRGPIGINGENSWNVAVYATDSADGKGTRYNQVRQALNNAKSATRLVPFTTSNIGIVSYNLNMTDLNCEQAQYVCLHLTKCQESQYDFMISPTNANFDEDENAVYKCFPLDCDGDGQQTLVQISSIVWSIGTSALVIGEDDNTTLKYKAQMSEKSKYVEGNSLWRIAVNVGFDAEANSALIVSQRQLNNEMAFDVNIISRGPIGINGKKSWNVAVYATDSADGKGIRYKPVRQALTRKQSATRLVPFTTAKIGIVPYNLDMTELNCEQAQYEYYGKPRRPCPEMS